ncbi:hypothetical protein BDY21DRAFT_352555 [Lineolata rhizophorae]|uniref:Uncharacterized protein n=1 Tax=Lineolata rhizophorae TaxID=578093 RepID=A0A6A6NSE2_9PEZI|nr:hypothetical protein BDY21DRAFT_352555 [Lineolata rhizophorae]
MPRQSTWVGRGGGGWMEDWIKPELAETIGDDLLATLMERHQLISCIEAFGCPGASPQ